jgi:hypothetical protein
MHNGGVLPGACLAHAGKFPASGLFGAAPLNIPWREQRAAPALRIEVLAIAFRPRSAASM